MEYTNIRPISLTLFLASFLWVSSVAQDTIGIHIEKIKMECDRINKALPALKAAEEKISDQSTEGGVLKKFYDGNIIRKASLTLFGETGKLIAEYYFENSELIFVSQTEISYKVPIYMGKAEIDSTEDEKFYFDKLQLKLWIDHDGRPVDPILYPNKEKDLLNDLQTIINKPK